MKRSAFVLFVPLLFALHSQAQGFHLGIKAGANLFKIDGESFSQEFQYGYAAGVFSEIYFTPTLGIQPEVMFNQTNYRTASSFSQVYQVSGFDDIKGKLDYLSIPVLLNIRPIPFLSLLIGPQFGILLNPNEHLVDNAQQAFTKGAVSAVGGAQLNLASVKIGARYVIGLTDINNIQGSDVNWKNQGWQLYAGFRIF